MRTPFCVGLVAWTLYRCRNCGCGPGARLSGACTGRLARIRPLCATAECTRRSTHQFAHRARRRSSVDDTPSQGAAPRARLRTDRNVVALAFGSVRSGPAPELDEVNLILGPNEPQQTSRSGSGF